MTENYTIAESFTLPSLGKVYSQAVNPEIKLRSMTTLEEMKRLSPSDKQYKNICEIIDDCLLDKPGISAYDMCLADYQFLLHKLRIVTYGANYRTSTKCPYCYSTNEQTVNLEELEVVNYTDDLNKYFEVDLPQTKKHIRLRMQTPRIIDDIGIKAKEQKQKMPNIVGDPAFIFTLAALIDTVDGQILDPIKKENWIKNLPMQDTNYIIQYGGKLNDFLGIKTSTSTTCIGCGLAYTNSFRINSEFFGPRIDI